MEIHASFCRAISTTALAVNTTKTSSPLFCVYSSLTLCQSSIYLYCMLLLTRLCDIYNYRLQYEEIPH